MRPSSAMRPKERIPRTKTVVQLEAKEDNNTQITKDLQDLRDQIRDRAGDSSHDETIKSMQMKQMEQRKTLMDTIE